MQITIRAGAKEGETTVGAAIARVLMEHGLAVTLDDGLGDDDGAMLQIAQNPTRMGLQLRALQGARVTIVTEQTQRNEKT